MQKICKKTCKYMQSFRLIQFCEKMQEIFKIHHICTYRQKSRRICKQGLQGYHTQNCPGSLEQLYWPLERRRCLLPAVRAGRAPRCASRRCEESKGAPPSILRNAHRVDCFDNSLRCLDNGPVYRAKLSKLSNQAHHLRVSPSAHP
jgi:hypothetical protein